MSKNTEGTAGGHGPMAGARIPVEGRSQRSRADIRRKIVHKVVTAFGQDYRHFQRMVGPKDTELSIQPPPPRPTVDSSKPTKNGKSETASKSSKVDSSKPTKNGKSETASKSARADSSKPAKNGKPESAAKSSKVDASKATKAKSDTPARASRAAKNGKSEAAPKAKRAKKREADVQVPPTKGTPETEASA